MISRRISVIDSHTGGEPTRAIVAGGPDLGSGTVAERLQCLRRDHDAFRSAVVNEPRGSDVLVGALLCAPADRSCVAGVIFFNNVGYLGMCGHGAIGVAVTLAHLGRIAAGRHRLETPVGVVAFDYDGGHRVTVENVPSYRHAANVAVALALDVEGGTVLGDIAWGGNWFFLVSDHGQRLEPANVERLTEYAWRVRHALQRQGLTGAGGAEIDHIELFGPPSGPHADSRNFVLCPGKAYDRSPCGTGTSAKLACLHADGKLTERQIWRQESIIGSVFEGSFRLENGHLLPRITGSAYLCAEATLLLDSADPFPVGDSLMSRAVVVIGGGVIGAACAYYLCRDGWNVTIVDQAGFGRGCSHGNCGYVSPSHVLPLAGPGAIRMALASLFKPDSPFRVKPRFDLSLFSWFWKFARRCNQHDMLAAARAIQTLLNSSRRLYDELLQAEAIECEWEPRGTLFVFRTAAALEHHAHTDQLLREQFAVASERYDGNALVALEPALKPGLAGGWRYPADAHLRPDRLLASWRRVLESRGVTIRENCTASQLKQHADGQAQALVTSQGELPADRFVVAMGAWTPLWQRQLGCRIPIQPGKGYSLTMPRPQRCPVYPLLFEEHRVAVTPMQSGYRLGSTMEFAGYDATLDPRRLDILRRGASHYLHEPCCEPVQEAWFGWRPMTYDGLPIIDRSPAMPNVLIAAGHNMLGISMATATGKLVAELLGERDTHVDPAPYALNRFCS